MLPERFILVMVCTGKSYACEFCTSNVVRRTVSQQEIVIFLLTFPNQRCIENYANKNNDQQGTKILNSLLVNEKHLSVGDYSRCMTEPKPGKREGQYPKLSSISCWHCGLGHITYFSNNVLSLVPSPKWNSLSSFHCLIII